MEWIAAIIAVGLFFSFPQKMSILIGVIALGYGVAYLYEEKQKKERKDRIDAVSFNAFYSSDKFCSKEYPIYLSIRNNSKEVVLSTEWNFEAKKMGHSGNLATYTKKYSSDKILNPGEFFKACYMVPALKGSDNPKNLHWLASGKYINFEGHFL